MESDSSELDNYTDYPCYVCERGLLRVGSGFICDICNLPHLYCLDCQRMRPLDFFVVSIECCSPCFLERSKN